MPADELLARVARCVADNARAEDVLGRVGGDEFAWLMPETTREQALVAVERARRLIAATVSQPFRITVSAGICGSMRPASWTRRAAPAGAARDSPTASNAH